MGCCKITITIIAPSLKILKMLLVIVVYDWAGESELVYASVKCFDNELKVN